MRREQCTFVIPERPSLQTRPVLHTASVSRTQSLVLSSPWLPRGTVFFLSSLLPFQSWVPQFASLPTISLKIGLC